VESGNVQGITLASANLLGKNYVKQVDVVMYSWQTGPELMISTKRMDSSFGKNAANRVEESYSDAKNLRLRHPLVAAGVEQPSDDDAGGPPADLSNAKILATIAQLPKVKLRNDAIPPELNPARFLTVMVERVLINSTINFHTEARTRHKDAAAISASSS
jgi:hypothetical protein